MFAKIRDYLSLVKFSHTVFAMPFALIGFFLGCTRDGFDVRLLVLVILCMVFARNAAMAYNRYADRKIDAVNPRTRQREIPAGKISPRQAIGFVAVNSALFVATAFFINRLSFYLSPVALAVILGYTLTKRFTSFCHIFIGLSLSIAPIGAYIAVTGRFDIAPLILSVLVLTWVSGFDIIYSLQDAEFDRRNDIHSIPSRWGVRGALAASLLLHLVTLAAVWVYGIFLGGGTLYWIGAGLFAALLAYQHAIVSPRNLSRVNVAFGTVNGIASLVYAFFTILDLFY